MVLYNKSTQEYKYWSSLENYELKVMSSEYLSNLKCTTDTFHTYYPRSTWTTCPGYDCDVSENAAGILGEVRFLAHSPLTVEKNQNILVLGLQGNLKEEVKMLELLLLSLTVVCIYILAKRWWIHIVRSVLFSKRFLSTFLIINPFSAALSQKLPQNWQKSHKKLRFLVKEFPKPAPLHLIKMAFNRTTGRSVNL